METDNNNNYESNASANKRDPPKTVIVTTAMENILKRDKTSIDTYYAIMKMLIIDCGMSVEFSDKMLFWLINASKNDADKFATMRQKLLDMITSYPDFVQRREIKDTEHLFPYTMPLPGSGVEQLPNLHDTLGRLDEQEVYQFEVFDSPTTRDPFFKRVGHMTKDGTDMIRLRVVLNSSLEPPMMEEEWVTDMWSNFPVPASITDIQGVANGLEVQEVLLHRERRFKGMMILNLKIWRYRKIQELKRSLWNNDYIYGNPYSMGYQRNKVREDIIQFYDTRFLRNIYDTWVARIRYANTTQVPVSTEELRALFYHYLDLEIVRGEKVPNYATFLNMFALPLAEKWIDSWKSVFSIRDHDSIERVSTLLAALRKRTTAQQRREAKSSDEELSGAMKRACDAQLGINLMRQVGGENVLTETVTFLFFEHCLRRAKASKKVSRPITDNMYINNTKFIDFLPKFVLCYPFPTNEEIESFPTKGYYKIVKELEAQIKRIEATGKPPGFTSDDLKLVLGEKNLAINFVTKAVSILKPLQRNGLVEMGDLIKLYRNAKTTLGFSLKFNGKADKNEMDIDSTFDQDLSDDAQIAKLVEEMETFRISKSPLQDIQRLDPIEMDLSGGNNSVEFTASISTPLHVPSMSYSFNFTINGAKGLPIIVDQPKCVYKMIVTEPIHVNVEAYALVPVTAGGKTRVGYGASDKIEIIPVDLCVRCGEKYPTRGPLEGKQGECCWNVDSLMTKNRATVFMKSRVPWYALGIIGLLRFCVDKLLEKNFNSQKIGTIPNPYYYKRLWYDDPSGQGYSTMSWMIEEGAKERRRLESLPMMDEQRELENITYKKKKKAFKNLNLIDAFNQLVDESASMDRQLYQKFTCNDWKNPVVDGFFTRLTQKETITHDDAALLLGSVPYYSVLRFVKNMLCQLSTELVDLVPQWLLPGSVVNKTTVYISICLESVDELNSNYLELLSEAYRKKSIIDSVSYDGDEIMPDLIKLILMSGPELEEESKNAQWAIQLFARLDAMNNRIQEKITSRNITRKLPYSGESFNSMGVASIPYNALYNSLANVDDVRESRDVKSYRGFHSNITQLPNSMTFCDKDGTPWMSGWNDEKQLIDLINRGGGVKVILGDINCTHGSKMKRQMDIQNEVAALEAAYEKNKLISNIKKMVPLILEFNNLQP